MAAARGVGQGTPDEARDAARRVEALITRHGPALLRVANHFSLCQDDALDAYQHALEIYLRRLDTVDPATEGAWMRVVVKHEAMAIRRARQSSVGHQDVDLDGALASGGRDVEDHVAGGERVERSVEALHALKPDEAKALMLKAEGLSYDEIGRRFGWTYTNVMSTLAVFIALGGGSYAAITINGRAIKNHSIAGKKLRRNTVAGREVRESRLGKVPRAHRADLLNGMSAGDLRAMLSIKCPADTFPTADVCVERTARPPQSYGGAVITCLGVGTPAGPGRRLPTHGELMAALGAVRLAPGGELTSDVYPSSTVPGKLNVLYITDQVGSVGVTTDTGAGSKAFRCVTDPLN